MIKLLVVVCAFFGAFAVAKGYFHLGSTACWVISAIVAMLGLGLSNKG